MSKVEKRNFRLKMHLACSADALRPILGHVKFDNGFMIATDAHIIVKAAVLHHSDFDHDEVQILNGKLLHRDTFKKILSVKMVKVTEDGIVDLATNDLYKFGICDSKYPNYEAVWPVGQHPIDEIGVAPAVALKLMKILNDSHSVRLAFNAKNRGIVVTAEGVDCVWMPTMINVA